MGYNTQMYYNQVSTFCATNERLSFWEAFFVSKTYIKKNGFSASINQIPNG